MTKITFIKSDEAKEVLYICPCGKLMRADVPDSHGFYECSCKLVKYVEGKNATKRLAPRANNWKL